MKHRLVTINSNKKEQEMVVMVWERGDKHVLRICVLSHQFES